MTALKPRMTVRWTQLPPITLIMLTAFVSYLVFGAAWLLGGAWQAMTHFSVAILLLALLGACVGLASALTAGRRRSLQAAEPDGEVSGQD